ncbi:hypothetical protein BJ742DRAFT_790125 [Cladochytrium replicatum]|nr:hypothetical protein BJ742DRAFT_790125 [Cladochytrium replicatum]
MVQISLLSPSGLVHHRSNTSPEPGPDEWFLIELQGIVGTDSNSGSVSGLNLGELTFDGEMPILTIGHNRLKGKRIRLEKPVAVLRKESEHLSKPTNIARTSQPSENYPELWGAQTLAISESMNFGNSFMDDSFEDTGFPATQPLEEAQSEEGVKTRWQIVAVAWYKYLFNDRPDHIVRSENNKNRIKK